MTSQDICAVCGKEKDVHPISFDSVGEDYVDEEAGDMMCNECHVTEKKRLLKEIGGT